MLPTHVAARELERRRAELRSELARQLPLFIEECPPVLDDEDAPVAQPDWAVNY